MLRRLVTALRRDDRGVTIVEYGIAITLAVAVGGIAMSTLANQVTNNVNAARNVMP